MLGVRESTVSRGIRDLEDLLGASLFQRRAGGISPTLAGQSFLERVRVAFGEFDEGAKEVAAIGRSERGQIRIGLFPLLASSFLFDLIRDFWKEHPEVSIELTEGDPAEHVAAIRQLELDVALVTGNTDRTGCETEYLWSEHIFVVLPSGHPLTSRNQLTWTDLENESFIVSDTVSSQAIHHYIVDKFSTLRKPPTIHPQKVGRDNLLSLVASGYGLTIASEIATVKLAAGVTYLPIRGELLPCSAVWASWNDNPAFRRFLSLARSMARSR